MAKKILLADDSITIQKVVELTFSDGDYEIVAVNNGSKAIQKLQEMRPDIILSDIIMPEKNGYEVCEFVKSHPDYKTIPVILLTGTFEPFDPDRAERAGCDAVVTKPFESQSLIHKVEELIQHAAAPSGPEPPAPSPFDETHSEKRTELEATPSRSQEDEPFAEPAQPSPEEIFGIGPEPEAPAAAAPLDRSGSVFDETNPPRSAAEPSPLFGEPQTSPEPPASSAETTGFPKMSFADLQRMQMEAGEPAAPPQPEPEAAPEPGFSAATTAFPKMSFDDFQRMSQDASAPPPPQPEEPSSGPEHLEWPRAARPLEQESRFGAALEPAPAPAGFGFDAPAEEPKVIPFEPPPPPSFAAPEPQPEPEPEPSYSGATTAFPKMSFDDLQRLREESTPPPTVEELPWTSSPEPLIGGPAGEEPPATPQTAPAAGDRAASLSDSLSEEQIDRIARRVVELMADKAVRDIAWEVIPDLAQVIVRERIRELETEA